MTQHLYRTGVVIATSTEGMMVGLERPCGDCGAGCSAAAPVLSLFGADRLEPGTDVRLGLPASLFNRHCAAVFGPWLLVVAGLICLDAIGMTLLEQSIVVLVGGLSSLWSGRALSLRLGDLGVSVTKAGPQDGVAWRGPEETGVQAHK